MAHVLIVLFRVKSRLKCALNATFVQDVPSLLVILPLEANINNSLRRRLKLCQQMEGRCLI